MGWTPRTDARALGVAPAKRAPLPTNMASEIEHAMDDDNGDRGDVAPPATHMPRSMSGEMPARCAECGSDLSIDDHKAGAHIRGCGAKFGEMLDSEPDTIMEADSDHAHKGGVVVPAWRTKSGKTHMAPPPPGPPMRMSTRKK